MGMGNGNEEWKKKWEQGMGTGNREKEWGMGNREWGIGNRNGNGEWE